MSKYINPYTAELANMTPEQRDEYEKSRMTYLEVKAVADTAEMDGHKRARYEMAKAMKESGEPIDKIHRYTGLDDNEIAKL